MAQEGSAGPSQANPLGLGLGFVDGAALVTLKDREVAEGLTLRALELELAEVEFPLDLEGGAEEFQRRSTRLVHLVFEADLRVLEAALEDALIEQGRALRGVRIVVDAGRCLLEGRLGAEGTPVAIEAVPGPSDDGGVEIHLANVHVFGAGRLPDLAVAKDFEVAVRSALGRVASRAAESLGTRGPWALGFDPVGALLWALLPTHGWKVPRYDGIAIESIGFTPGGALQLVVGASRSGAEPPPAELVSEPALVAARAREDQERLVPAVEAQFSDGAFTEAFEVLLEARDLDPNPRIVDRLLSIGAAEPALAEPTRDLAQARLEATPDDVPARLARAALADRAGDAARAAEDYEHAARRLRRDGLRRRAGLAYRAAALQTPSGTAERARLFEETIALRPDDGVALLGLVEVLPGLGRASAAVRAARRLAKLSPDPLTRLQAHLTAGQLLLEQVEDSAGAKREWDRALKLSPDHPEALEGLARVLIAKGDTRRAASLLDRLVQQAERADDLPRAARLCLRLGDLWRPLDADAALARYRRAHTLAPRSARPLLAMAELSEAAGDTEAALEVLDEALPNLEGVPAEDDRASLVTLRLLAGRLFAASEDRGAEAVAQLEAALELEPGHEAALEALIALHTDRGEPAAAAELLGRRAARALDRGAPDAAVDLWRAELAVQPDPENHAADLRPRVEAALESRPQHRGLLDLLVEVSAGRPDALIEALERRLMLQDPPQVRGPLWAELGLALQSTDDDAGAIRAFEEAVSASPEERGAAFALVSLYRSRADEARLESALARAAGIAESATEQADLHAERARLLAARGEEGEAWVAAQSALQAQPQDAALLPFATQLALQTGEASAARELIERRLRLLEDQPGAARLSAFVDLAKVEEIVQDRRALVGALEQAYAVADPHSEAGRRLAARLARELEARGDDPRLAALQRDRSRVETAPPGERADLALDAARRYERLDALADAEEEVKVILDLSETGAVEAAVVDAALDVLEQLAERQPDPGRRARAKVLRAQRASGPEADALRLEGARILEAAGRGEAAMAVIEDAGPSLSRSRPLLEALGALRLAGGAKVPAAEAFAAAAGLAEDDDPNAASLHARAAAAYADADRLSDALEHDRRVLEFESDPTQAGLSDALTRLERLARETDDGELLAEVLGRRADTVGADAGAELLLEKADLHMSRPGQEKAGLAALRRAHALSAPDPTVSDAVAARLVESLMQVGLFAEQAAVLSEWAERTPAGPARAERLFRAADVYASRLRDRSMALSRAQAAVRADPHHEAARNLRIGLLRDEGRTDDLAEALAEEAAGCQDADEASERWLEAAKLVAPLDALGEASPDALERALDLVRRAATAAPGALGPVEAEVSYGRALGRPDDELSALGRLVDRALPAPQAAAARLRRAHLLRGALGDDVAAQAELDAALGFLLNASSDDVEATAAALPSISLEAYEIGAPDDLVKGALQSQLEVTEQLQDWAGHVAVLSALGDHSDSSRERASLMIRAGEILEWRLGDGAAAEREYLTALATDPDSSEARRAISQFFVAVDRFGSLAESLGVEALVEVFEGFSDEEPPRRIAAAAEALWPELPEGSSERADVQLRLSNLYARLDEHADVVHALEQVVQTGPRPHQDEALSRLRALFERMERHDLLVDVLRRQAERIDTAPERALALAELGHALEWKVGDGPGAEQEYRAALAADSTCDEARLRLAQLLSSQDRFDEIATDLGPDDLEDIVDRLLEQGSRDRERVFAAGSALGAHVDEATRGRMWLRVASALEGSSEDETARTREALESAAESPSTQSTALARLAELLERLQDQRALAEVLGRRAAVAESPREQVELHMEHARRLEALVSAGELEAEPEELEAPLRAVIAVDPTHEPARRRLITKLSARGAWGDLGELAGDEALAAAQAEAEADGDLARAKEILRTRADRAEGSDRAMALVDLVGLVEFEPDTTPEDEAALYREALEADPDCAPAREGLRVLFEEQGRFREIGEMISPDALRTTIRSLKQLDDEAQLLPAILALAAVLADDPSADDERARLFIEAAALHQSEEDEDAAEHALRSALEIDPEHPLAREELAGVLVGQGRLEALADVDPTLVAQAAARASEIGDQEVEIRALRVLATRREGREQADTLVLVAALEKARGHDQAAEEDLTRALEHDPEHSLARSELETILWTAGRYEVALERLGPQAFLQRAATMVEDSPEALVAAVRAAADRLDDASRAEAWELCAAAALPDETAEWRRRRRFEAADRARAIWDRIDGAEGALRTRLVLVDLTREDDDVSALLAALRDASGHAVRPEDKATLAIEQATLLALTDAREEARALVEPLVQDERVPLDHRRGAARILVEDLLPAAPEVDPDASPEWALRAAALELLTRPPLEAGPHAVRWCLDLAAAREALDEEPERVAEALEAALEAGAQGDFAHDVHARLRDLYDELGDWRGAERHASVIAAAKDDPEAWVQVSELRVWLDDRDGAERALQSALSAAPDHAEAHASLLRLAEQTGDRASVIERLESWATSEADSDPSAGLERLMRALDLAVEEDDETEAARLAERTLDLAPPGQEAEIAQTASEQLGRLGAAEAQVNLLTRAVSGARDVPPTLRLTLADRLVELGRAEEARTVVQAGLRRDASEQDPLVQRALDEAASLEDDAAVRRLLELAERLERGPAARRARAMAAERAEDAGDRAAARQAWSRVLSEVGAGDRAVAARAALVRLARADRDDRALLGALLESVDDATTPPEKAARLVEAADLAEGRLDAPAQAEALLRRARRLVPDDRDLAARFVDHLQSRGRWAELDAELRERAVGTSGAARAAIDTARAEIAHRHLEDELKAARLWVEAYEAEPTAARGRRAVESLHAAGVLDEALALAERVSTEVTAEPGEREALERARADLLEALGRVDEAVSRLLEQSASLPATSVLQQKLQQMLARHRRFGELADYLERVAPDLGPGEGMLSQLASARIRAERLDDQRGARGALEGALAMVEGWMAASGSPIPDEIAPPPAVGAHLSERLIFEAPLLDLATLADQIGAADVRVSALRLYAQSLPEGLAQWRVLLMLAGAEREAGDLEAAEFTLRGVVEAIRDAAEVDASDRAEAERSLGALLLDRGDPSGAVEALSRAKALLQEESAEADSERAEVLVLLSEAHRAAGDPGAGMRALVQASLLEPGRVEPAELEAAVDAAGPSAELAGLMVERASRVVVPAERAAKLRAAAEIWTSIGRPEAALEPQIAAYEADPSNADEAARLEASLREAERWEDLDRLLDLRLRGEHLGDDARAGLLDRHARVLETHRAAPEQALELFIESAALAPKPEVLRAVARLADEVGRADIEQDALARLAASSEAPAPRRRALLAKAKSQGPVQGVAALESALEISFDGGFDITPLASRLAEHYAARGDHASQARLWVRVAGSRSGVSAAAAFARAAEVRLERLDDRRGAASALEAACRRAPEDLGVRRAALSLAESLGDARRAEKHARSGVEVALSSERPKAAAAFARALARELAASGQASAELDAWRQVVELGPSVAALDELVTRARESLPAEAVVELLASAAAATDAPEARARLLFGQARVLDDPLGRNWEAEGLRADALALDPTLAPPLDAGGDVSSADLDEAEYRTMRSMLDRSGRWSELAALEEQQAARLPSRGARARALLEVAALHEASDAPDHFERATDALRRAVALDPDLVEAHAALVRRQAHDEAWAEARATLDALDALGGPPWPMPEAELLAAAVAEGLDDSEGVQVALRAALERDPDNVEVRGRLARLDPSPTRLAEWVEVLDPVLDASTLAEVSVVHAEQALEAGSLDAALDHADAAIQAAPRSASACGVRRRVLQAREAGPEAQLSAWLDEVAALDPEAARGSLAAAIDFAAEHEVYALLPRVASLSAPHVGEDEPLRRRLADLWKASDEGPGLVAALDLLEDPDALGALDEPARARLGRALLDLDRDEEAWRALLVGTPDGSREELEQSWAKGELRTLATRVARALSPESGDAELSQPQVRARLRAAFSEARGPLGPHALAALTRLVVMLPRERGLAERLAAALRDLDCAEDAAAEYRALLARDPASVEHLDALLAVQTYDEARGPRAARAWLRTGRGPDTLLPRLVGPLAEAQMRRLHPVSDLGAALRLSSGPLSRVLPPAFDRPERLTLAERDARSRDAWAAVVEASGTSILALVDPEGGAAVRLEPGEHPSLAIGEALLAQASPAELRFRLARAAFAAEAGYMLLDRAPGAARHDVLVALADAAEGVDEADGSGLSSQLDAETRARLAELAPRLRGATDLDFARWRAEVLRAASRFGLLVAGDLGAALGGLDRLEPRALGASRSSEPARLAALRRWGPLADLITWLTQEDYARLLGEARFEAPPAGP